MRKLVLFAHISLDGFASDVNNSLGFLTYDKELQQHADQIVKTVGSPVYGKNTYDLMAGYWPTVLNNPSADQHSLEHAKWVQEVPKIVFSTTMKTADWNNTRLIKSNVQEEIQKLKEAPGKDLVVFGSPTLSKSLMNFGLIDEYQLTMHPIILGKGISLFDSNTQMSKLKLLESKTLGSGVITLHYVNR